MIEMLSGTSAGWLTVLKTMNSPRRSIFASSDTFIGGSIGISPSPSHWPISGSNAFIVGLLSEGIAFKLASMGITTGGRGATEDGLTRTGHDDRTTRRRFHLAPEMTPPNCHGRGRAVLSAPVGDSSNVLSGSGRTHRFARQRRRP